MREAETSPTDGVIRLFDGKSLDGLYTWLKDTKYEDPRQVFRVTDGMLHITGNGLGAVRRPVLVPRTARGFSALTRSNSSPETIA